MTPRRSSTSAPDLDDRFDVPLRGVGVDGETRCAHYDGDRDVVAIRFPCCGVYYPCYRCHAEATNHDPEVLPSAAFDEPGILCGRCRTTHAVSTYLAGDDACPDCAAAFNPNCRDHHYRYFED